MVGVWWEYGGSMVGVWWRQCHLSGTGAVQTRLALTLGSNESAGRSILLADSRIKAVVCLDFVSESSAFYAREDRPLDALSIRFGVETVTNGPLS